MISEEVKGHRIISVCDFKNTEPPEDLLTDHQPKVCTKNQSFIYLLNYGFNPLTFKTHPETVMNPTNTLSHIYERMLSKGEISNNSFSVRYSGEGVVSCVSEEVAGGQGSLTWIWAPSDEAGPSTHSTTNKWWVPTHTDTHCPGKNIQHSAFSVRSKIMDSTPKCKHPHRFLIICVKLDV